MHPRNCQHEHCEAASEVLEHFLTARLELTRRRTAFFATNRKAAWQKFLDLYNRAIERLTAERAVKHQEHSGPVSPTSVSCAIDEKTGGKRAVPSI